MLSALPRRLAGALALSGALFVSESGRAQAAETPFSLSYSAPADCPNEAALRAEVLRLAPEAASGVPGFSAKGSVTRVVAGYELELETLYGERRGSRRMSDPSCTELTRAAAVVIALAIRPESATPEEAPAVPPEKYSDPQPRAEIQPVPAPASAPRPAPPPPPPPSKQEVEAWVSAAFAGELGTLPGFAPGVLVGAEARTAALRIGVSGEYLPKQHTTPDSPGDPTLAVDYWGVDAWGCLGLLRQKLAPGGCVGLGVGNLRGESRGATTQGDGNTIWVTPRLGGFLLYRALPSLSLEAGAHARFSLLDASFNVENYGPVYETAPVALLLTAGATLRIW